MEAAARSAARTTADSLTAAVLFDWREKCLPPARQKNINYSLPVV
jgi:hypothetical protein